MKTKKYVPQNKFEVRFHDDYVRLAKKAAKLRRGEFVKITDGDRARALAYVQSCRKERCSTFLPAGYWLLRWATIYQALSGSWIEFGFSDRRLVQYAFHFFLLENNVRQCASLAVTSLWLGFGIDFYEKGKDISTRKFL